MFFRRTKLQKFEKLQKLLENVLRFNALCSLRVSLGVLYKLDNCDVELYHPLRKKTSGFPENNFERKFLKDKKIFKSSFSNNIYIHKLNIFLVKLKGYDNFSIKICSNFQIIWTKYHRNKAIIKYFLKQENFLAFFIYLF